MWAVTYDPDVDEFDDLVLDIMAAEQLDRRHAALRALDLIPLFKAGDWQPPAADRYVAVLPPIDACVA